MILVLDNYDSFVHNLARLVRLAGRETHVVRSDEIDTHGIDRLGPDAIVISPGPGRPSEAGCSVAAVQAFAPRLPILGVCLGHQAIVEAFGGRVVLAKECFHGRTSAITHRGAGLFAGVPSPLTVCRYHSLVGEPDTLPDELAITACTTDGEVMAVAHRELPLFGVQFHPEAILTEHGQRLIDNFVGVTATTLQR